MLHPFLQKQRYTVYGITLFLLFKFYTFSKDRLVREATKWK